MIRNRRAVCSGFLKATSGASVLALGLALAMPMSASAQAVNFAGKTVEWIIPFGVGGGLGWGSLDQAMAPPGGESPASLTDQFPSTNHTGIICPWVLTPPDRQLPPPYP